MLVDTTPGPHRARVATHSPIEPRVDSDLVSESDFAFLDKQENEACMRRPSNGEWGLSCDWDEDESLDLKSEPVDLDSQTWRIASWEVALEMLRVSAE